MLGNTQILVYSTLTSAWENGVKLVLAMWLAAYYRGLLNFGFLTYIWTGVKPFFGCH